MALQLFPEISKKAILSDGTSYAYIRVPAADPTKPTFLLLHGFPSSSYDWRRIIPKLKEEGYGIIAPDLLGYGDSDKPTDPSEYAMKRMADNLLEIVHTEGLTQVIGVGHDWGSGFLSIAALAHPTLFSGVIFLAVGYHPPGPFDIDEMNSMAEKFLGHPINWYMKFFNEDSAASVMDANPESLTSLVYPTTPEDWKINMCPLGAAKEWVSSGKVAPPPEWLSQEELDTHVRIFQKGKYTGPLNWYKAAIRGINEPYYSTFTTEESKNINVPAIVVVGEYDYACPPEFQKPNTEKYLSDAKIVQLQCGHWTPLEKADEVARLLEGFAKDLQVHGRL